MNSGDEITIILDERLFPMIENYLQNYSYYHAFSLLQIGSFKDEPGLVKKIATLFADNGIPILYTTTYNNNYVFVPEKYKDIATLKLNPPLLDSEKLMSK